MPQIAISMGPTWGPPGSCRLQMGPMLAPWTLLSGAFPLDCYNYSKRYSWCWFIQNTFVTMAWSTILHKAYIPRALRWRHNGHAGVSNHQSRDCLLNRLFRRTSKKTSKLRVTGLCAGNSPGTGEFPAQRASYAENVSIWWRHHDYFELHQGLSSLSGDQILCQVRVWFNIKIEMASQILYHFAALE